MGRGRESRGWVRYPAGPECLEVPGKAGSRLKTIQNCYQLISKRHFCLADWGPLVLIFKFKCYLIINFIKLIFNTNPIFLVQTLDKGKGDGYTYMTL